mmetsp:Transcript_2289/g.6861  ORF Transcript_2289/g.6861 Transcript_2289/m.6861 type:complete len:130 (+) Transcript_2289:133-522(+)
MDGGDQSKNKRRKLRRFGRRSSDPDVDEPIGDLRGTTAANARRMTEEERNIMLFKRKLRNREAAFKSREKQKQLAMEVKVLMRDSCGHILRIVRLYSACLRELEALKAENNSLFALKESLSARISVCPR